jgi:hypothetical protein
MDNLICPRCGLDFEKETHTGAYLFVCGSVDETVLPPIVFTEKQEELRKRLLGDKYFIAKNEFCQSVPCEVIERLKTELIKSFDYLNEEG